MCTCECWWQLGAVRVGSIQSDFIISLSQITYRMTTKQSNKTTPPKSQNLKLKQKSQAFSDVTHVSQRSYQFQAAQQVKHLNLDIFKVSPCNITKSHNHKQCINYHSAKDRRRYGHFYSTDLCPHVRQQSKCPQGQGCPYAHSTVEEHYHYQKYKKYFCFHYPYTTQQCGYGDFCSYAHHQEQILSTLIHNYLEDADFYMFYYKTEFCPFNLTKHEPSKCVYAHNWQDYRRRPDHYTYEPIPCYNWKTKDYISISDYSSGCEIGVACNMCHGWKEHEYHPSYYKTVKCEEQGCKKGSCYKYHSQKQRRAVQPEVTSHAFKYVPKNRIVEGVFKCTVNKEGFKQKTQNKTRTVVQLKEPESLAPEANQFKARTLVTVKQKRRSNEKEKSQWIKEKKIIDSEEESDQNQNEIVASQLQKLDLD